MRDLAGKSLEAEDLNLQMSFFKAQNFPLRQSWEEAYGRQFLR